MESHSRSSDLLRKSITNRLVKGVVEMTHTLKMRKRAKKVIFSLFREDFEKFGLSQSTPDLNASSKTEAGSDLKKIGYTQGFSFKLVAPEDPV